MEHRQARHDLAELWGDTSEGRIDQQNNSWFWEDVFDLRRLFGEEPYMPWEEEEEHWEVEEWEEEEEEWEEDWVDDMVAPGG